MYLMDSIVKNVGREYLTAFTKNLVATFICVFEKVHIYIHIYLETLNFYNVPDEINTCLVLGFLGWWNV